MSTKKETTAIEKAEKFDLTNPSRENVPALLSVVAKKLAELKGNAPEKTGTDKEFPGFGKKIKDVSSVEDLIKMHSAVTNRSKTYKESAEILGVSTKKYPFKLNGHTEEEWVNDIKFRTAEVKNEKDIKRLEKIETTLSKYLSEEDKLKKDLAAIGSDLSDELDD